MADYFQEMGWTPLPDGQTPDQLLELLRLFRNNDFLNDFLLPNELSPPASKNVVENLPQITIDKADVKCPVCLKDYDKEVIVLKLPCNHLFHSGCIKPWLTKTNSCPVCRYELPTDDEEYENLRKEKLREKQREEDIANLHNSMFT